MASKKSKKIVAESQNLNSYFAGKIKTIEQIKKIIGKRQKVNVPDL